jgi:hypothetical protein
LRIEKLEVNDSLDLSDGFMDHFITREKWKNNQQFGTFWARAY